MIVCSTAVRARQTCAGLLKAASFAPSVVFEQRLYGARISALHELVQATSEDCSTLMLIGHEPTSSSAVEWLTGCALDHFPTAAMASISFAGLPWQSVARCTGSLLWLQKPRELPAE